MIHWEGQLSTKLMQHDFYGQFHQNHHHMVLTRSPNSRSPETNSCTQKQTNKKTMTITRAGSVLSPFPEGKVHS
jgi:hypothetical protein